MGASGVFIYVAEAGGKQIAVFRMAAEDGRLTKVQELPVNGKVMPMAVTPDRRFLFAAIRSQPYTIASFAINGLDGTLSPCGRTPAPESIVYLSTDHTGQYLIGACNPSDSNRKTGVVKLSRIGTDGCVQAAPALVRTPPKLHAVLPDPSNRFIFGTSCNGDMIMRYAFDATTGMLSADGLAPVLVLPKSGPRHMRFHPNNRFFYIVNEYDASVVAYKYDVSNGTILEMQTVNALPPGHTEQKNWRAADLHFTPDGKWLYVSARVTSTFAVFSVDPLTGMLEARGHFPTPPEPRGFTIDPSGRYLFAAAFLSKSVTAFKINPENGVLDKIEEYKTGEGPNWLEIVRLF